MKNVEKITGIYREITQEGKDKSIIKIIWLADILKDYSRLLLGDDIEDCLKILPPLLDILLERDEDKEDKELIIALIQEHRVNRTLLTGDGILWSILERLKGKPGALNHTQRAEEDKVNFKAGKPQDFLALFKEKSVAERLKQLKGSGELFTFIPALKR